MSFGLQKYRGGTFPSVQLFLSAGSKKKEIFFLHKIDLKETWMGLSPLLGKHLRNPKDQEC